MDMKEISEIRKEIKELSEILQDLESSMEVYRKGISNLAKYFGRELAQEKLDEFSKHPNYDKIRKLQILIREKRQSVIDAI